MAIPDEKLSKFIQAMTRDAEERRARILAQTEAFNKAEMEKAEMEALTEAYQLIQANLSQMRARVRRELSRKELALHREALLRRCAIADRVMKGAEDKVRAFTESPDYLELLRELAAEAASLAGDGPIELALREKDLPLAPELTSCFAGPCQVRVDDGILLGGLRARCPEKGVVIDETLDARLESQRRWFAEHAGLPVRSVGA